MRVGDGADVPAARAGAAHASRTAGSCRGCSPRQGGRRARAIEGYEFHRAALGVYDFVYGELCDWYLELVKPRLYGEDNRRRRTSRCTCSRETLALAHPVIPFVTEEIWAYLPGAERTCWPCRRWPSATRRRSTRRPRREVGAAIDAVKALRGWRDGLGVRAGRRAARAAVRATTRWPSTSRGSPAWSARATATEPARGTRTRRRRARGLRVRRTSTSRPRSAAPPSAAPSSRRRSRAPRASWPTRASCAKAPDGGRAGRARQARAAPDGAGRAGMSAAVAWSLERGGGAPPLAGAVRHALRPGAHAAAADRARLAAGALPGRSTSSAPTASPPPRASRPRCSRRHGVRAGAYLSPHLTHVRRAHPDRRRATSRRTRSAPPSQRAAAAAAQGRARRSTTASGSRSSSC